MDEEAIKVPVGTHRAGAGDTASTDKDRQFVTALARGLDILRAFRRGERALSNGVLASRTGLHKATVTRLTYTLTQLGYLEAGSQPGHYALGAGVLALGYAYLSGLPLRDSVRPLLAELAEQTEATVVLGARDRLQMVCLEVCQGHPMFRLNLDVGMRVPHGLTALGRAQLCVLQDDEHQEWLQRYRELASADDWPVLRDGIAKAIADYKQYGFCFSLGDWNRDVYAVGVPLAINGGTRLLALSLSGPVFNMTRERLIGDLGPRLVALRDRLSQMVAST